MTRLSETVINKVCALIKKGWSTSNICGKVGISVSSFKIWKDAGINILDMYEFDERTARKSIRENEFLNYVDKRRMLLHLSFAVKVHDAEATSFGILEEQAYTGATNDDTGRMAIELLQRRKPHLWAKQVAPAVMIESHPIKQIVIHGSEVKELEEGTVEGEYEDV